MIVVTFPPQKEKSQTEAAQENCIAKIPVPILVPIIMV